MGPIKEKSKDFRLQIEFFSAAYNERVFSFKSVSKQIGLTKKGLSLEWKLEVNSCVNWLFIQ